MVRSYSPTFVSFVARTSRSSDPFVFFPFVMSSVLCLLDGFQCHSSNVLNRNNSTSAEVRASGGNVYYIVRDATITRHLYNMTFRHL